MNYLQYIIEETKGRRTPENMHLLNKEIEQLQRYKDQHTAHVKLVEQVWQGKKCVSKNKNLSYCNDRPIQILEDLINKVTGEIHLFIIFSK